jgi:hypothetical protein
MKNPQPQNLRAVVCFGDWQIDVPSRGLLVLVRKQQHSSKFMSSSENLGFGHGVKLYHQSSRAWLCQLAAESPACPAPLPASCPWLAPLPGASLLEQIPPQRWTTDSARHRWLSKHDHLQDCMRI